MVPDEPVCLATPPNPTWPHALGQLGLKWSNSDKVLGVAGGCGDAPMNGPAGRLSRGRNNGWSIDTVPLGFPWLGSTEHLHLFPAPKNPNEGTTSAAQTTQ